ncbi:hypothetical protein LCGC14_3148900 [marine sediment metagenome]|uniref:Uncharacterized protein n=1 Tax=marine sediment metagenome TaxID=412755 RepID=A0A0F8VUN5_9ZZZZ
MRNVFSVLLGLVGLGRGTMLALDGYYYIGVILVVPSLFLLAITALIIFKGRGTRDENALSRETDRGY